jgi:hypothetical protein
MCHNQTMKRFFLTALIILTTACSPVDVTVPSEVTVTLTPSPIPTAIEIASSSTPDSFTATPEAMAPGPILAELGYSEADHEMFAPANYRIETREWEGAPTQVLVHTNPETKEERVDGMEVTINGEKEWVRGIYYKIETDPNAGGFVIDVMVHPLQNERAYFSTEDGAENVYGELKKAIAYQLEMTSEQLEKYLAEHDYKVKIRLPENLNPGSGGSPSLLKASEPVEVDLRKPIVFGARAEPYLNELLENGAKIPESAEFIKGDSRAKAGIFVSEGQIFIFEKFYGTVAVRKSGFEAHGLFRYLELLARMRAGFQDVRGGENSLIGQVNRMSGKGYETGDTIVDRNVFLTANSTDTDYEFTVFELK